MNWLPRKNVLVPTDFSEPSVVAIHTALDLVEHGHDIHVLYVLQPLEHTTPGVMFGHVDDESRIKTAQHHLEEFMKRHQLNGVSCSVRIGNPGLEIAAFAREKNVDLIVMPSHGYQGLRHILLGSVAERVLRHAECPVLVLRRADPE